VKFLAITLITHAPDQITGIRKSTQDRFREVLDSLSGGRLEPIIGTRYGESLELVPTGDSTGAAQGHSRSAVAGRTGRC
jgi:hypothetical protein